MITKAELEAHLDAFRSEELHEDLRPYVSSGRFNMLRHPLVYMVPYHEAMNRMANLQLASKRAALAAAALRHDGPSYIMLHERPHRFHALLETVRKSMLTSTEYWREVSDVWQDSENIWQNARGWRLLWSGWPLGEDGPVDFRIPPEARDRLVMTEEELAALDALGKAGPIRIYRGQRLHVPVGQSWTLDRDRAEFFAQRFPGKAKTGVIVGQVLRENVLAHLKGRGEEEIVVRPGSVDVVLQTEVGHDD